MGRIPVPSEDVVSADAVAFAVASVSEASVGDGRMPVSDATMPLSEPVDSAVEVAFSDVVKGAMTELRSVSTPPVPVSGMLKAAVGEGEALAALVLASVEPDEVLEEEVLSITVDRPTMIGAEVVVASEAVDVASDSVDVLPVGDTSEVGRRPAEAALSVGFGLTGS